MKRFDFRKDVLPHLLSILAFILLTLIYFNPAVFGGKSLKQHDILQYQGSAQEIVEYREEYKEEPLWTNSMFGGMPAYLISTLHNGEIIQKAANWVIGIFPHPTGMILIHLFSFYILLLAFGVRPVYAAIGAFAFAFASYTFISLAAGHNNKIKALGYAPLVLAGVILVFRNKLFSGFLIAAIGVALNIGSNHFQITYYLCFILFILGIVEFIFAFREKLLPDFFKKVAVLIFAAIIGLGANLGSFLTTFEYAKFTMRGGTELKPTEESNINSKGGLDKEYAFHWSYGVFESFSLLIPNIQGGASNGVLDKESNFYKRLVQNGVPEAQAEEYIKNAPLYWGDQPGTAGPTYLGAIVCFLFVLGMLILDTKTRIWLLTATVLAIMLSWGKNFASFNYIVFDYLPGYNKFRSVSWTLIIAQICVPLGAILALSKVIETRFSDDLFKKLLIATGITGGLCLLFAMFAGMAGFEAPIDEQLATQASWIVQSLREDREAILRADAIRSLILIVISAALIWAAWREKLSKLIAALIIGLLVIFDHWSVDKRYLNNENFERRVVEQHFAPTGADEAILADTTNYRVLNLLNPWNDARTSYYHQSVGGYSGAKMQRYQDMIDRHLSQETSRLVQNLQKGQLNFSDLDVLNMLNTKYFVFGETKNEVLTNPGALGNAWFVSEIEKVNNPDEEISALNAINPESTAVIDASKFDIQKLDYPKDSSASIKLVEYKPNHLIYNSENPSEGVAVFSEIYYPKGWEAYIDGEKEPILRVNYILRGLRIPAGKHKIEFKFEPKSYSIGNTVAMFSSIFLLVCALGLIFYRNKKRKDNILQE